MQSETVGDVMTESRNRALKTLAIVASMAVYFAMLLYTGVHNWTLLQSGVPEDLRLWSIIGVIALEISAFALPIALHWWTHAPLQRIAAFVFYAVDLGLLWLNVVLDFSLTSGTWSDFPDWLTLYLHFGVPATPLIAGLGWCILWLLDPSQKERAMLETLRASTREALAARVIIAARGTDIESMVSDAADALAYDVITKTLGTQKRPRRKLIAKGEDEATKINPTKS